MSSTASANDAVITAENGQLITASSMGAGNYAVGPTTLTAGQAYTLQDSEVINVGSTGLNIEGTPIGMSALTSGPALTTTGFALLTLGDQTVTAYEVPGTTGLGVVDDSTLSFRGQGYTLADGNVVSMGLSGLVESTATAAFSPPSASMRTSGLSTTSSTTSSRMPSDAASQSSTSPILTSTSFSGQTAGSQPPLPANTGSVNGVCWQLSLSVSLFLGVVGAVAVSL